MADVPMTSGLSRVFLIEGRARPDHTPQFKAQMRAGAPEQSFGDTTRVEAPDPGQYNSFIEIGEIVGAIERGSMDLIGRYPLELKSDLLRLAKQRCPLDVQLHFGDCSDPRSFNTFKKALILENVRIGSWSTGDLGALASDEPAPVDETAPLSFGEIFEVVGMTYAEKGGDVVVNPMIDVVICSNVACGDCATEDDGCNNIFAVSASTGGSPGTGPEVIWSDDKGVNLYADEITTLETTDTAEAIACVGDYVVVLSASADAHEYKLRNTILAGTAFNWTEVATGYVAAGSPRDIWSVGSFAFVVGDGGYIYGCSDPTAGVTVIDAGTVTANDLKAVHALDENFAVAVGDSDTIIYTTNQTSWVAATATGGGNGLLCVWAKSRLEWYVGDDGGNLYYTVDGGVTWTQITTLPTGATAVNDIAFGKDSIMFVAVDTATPRGRIHRSFNGGQSFITETVPVQDEINALAACWYDADFAVGVGLADDATDGIVIIGQG